MKLKIKNQKNLSNLRKLALITLFTIAHSSSIFATIGQLISGSPTVTLVQSEFQTKIQNDLSGQGYNNINLQSMSIVYENSLPIFKYVFTFNDNNGNNLKCNTGVPLIYVTASNTFNVDDVQIQNGGRKVTTCVSKNCGDGCTLNDDNCSNCNPIGEGEHSCTKTQTNEGGSGLDPWLTVLTSLVSSWVTWLIGKQ